VILAPATPCVAPRLGQVNLLLDGIELPVRPNIGFHIQPISFIRTAGGRGADFA
jgi:aspartyl-tRNA(Asn)/glutamyl-tRNA(Gln) amidotransferase subunit A